MQRGLDIGARYYRSVLGRELPAFRVWAYNDHEAIIQAYAQNEPTSSPEHSRRLWEGNQVAHATAARVWFGPAYFIPGRPEVAIPTVGALQIAAHEAFHLIQYELIRAQERLGVSGPDQVPVAGPWWLGEGVATYFAQLAVAREGLLRLAELQAQWRRSARLIGAGLGNLMTLRGQQAFGIDGYHAYTLAVELLLRDRDPRSVLTYYEAIGNGVPWQEAFASAFGRSHEALAAEYEAAKTS